MSRYVNEFLRLNCAPDVLASVGNLGNKPMKEITEAFGVIKKLRKIVLKEPNKYDLIDLCSGNALVPVIAAHLLPLDLSIAVDKLERKRHWKRTKHFYYIKSDIYDFNLKDEIHPIILTSVHCCKNLAERTIEIYNESPMVRHLILMPCCQGSLDNSMLQFIKDESTGDVAWATKLVLQCDGKVKMIRDKSIISPKNIIIMAKKEESVL